MRLAHLILAHSGPGQLERLIKRLSHPSADVYVHLDAKTSENPFLYLKKLPRVFKIKKIEKRFESAYSVKQVLCPKV